MFQNTNKNTKPLNIKIICDRNSTAEAQMNVKKETTLDFNNGEK